MHSNPSSQSPSVILGGQSHGPQASSSFLRGKKSSGTYETEMNCIGKKYVLLSKEHFTTNMYLIKTNDQAYL